MTHSHKPRALVKEESMTIIPDSSTEENHPTENVVAVDDNTPMLKNREFVPYNEQSLTEKRLLDIETNVQKLIAMLSMVNNDIDAKMNAFMTSLQIHLGMDGAPSAKPLPHENIIDAEIAQASSSSRRKEPPAKRDYRRA